MATTVLIVDDDKHTRALLERILHHDARIARHGVRVVQAGDGVEGLKVFDAEKPQVVITDLLMPRMDGFRFCKELRGRPDGKPVGLLVLSGVYRDVSISSRLREEFGATFYTKPYQIKDMVTALDKQLSRLNGGEAAESSRPIDAPPVVDATPLPAAHERRGGFKDTPLPRLLLDLYEDRATGVLELRRGRIEKRIDLVVGHPVAVSSNQRGEMLGHFLVLRGVISERVHQAALQRAHDEEKKLGEALNEMGVFSSTDLVKQLTAQARYKITTALRWPDGEWRYRPNRELIDSASKGNALDPVAVVFLGLKKTGSVEGAALAVAPLAGKQIALTARGERVKQGIVRVWGAPLVEQLAAAPAFDSLMATAPADTSRTMTAIESLLVTGCVADAGPAAARSSPSIAVARAAEPPPLEELSGSFRLPLPPPSSHGRVYDQVFGNESSDAGTPIVSLDDAEIVELGPDNEAVPEEIQLSDSSLIEVEVGPGAVGSGPVLEIEAEPGPLVEELREGLLREYLRLQGKDPYAALELGRDADAAAVEKAYLDHMAQYGLEIYEPYDMGPDHAKIEELHAAYRKAYETLITPDRRAAFDHESPSARRARSQDGAMMGAELAFRAGDRRMADGNFGGAVEHFRLALDSSPEVADYHAALGWAMFRAGGDQAREAAARISQALAIDPDHGAAHEYLGQVLAAEAHGSESAAEAAATHLERALDCQPPRLGALAPLEELRLGLGQPRLLERRYRALLRRVRPGENDIALRLWRGLAKVYLVLGDRDAARTAFQCAHRLAPEEATFLDALADLAENPRERADLMRERWRLEPAAARPGLALFAAANAEGRHDAAFLAAATLSARGLAEPQAEALHRRHRPRFLVRAMRPLGDELYDRIRHRDDDRELGALFAALEPVAHRHAPLHEKDLGMDDADRLGDGDLPEAFARVRDYVAHMLGVRPPPVVRRADFGGEAHLGALPEPVLLVGPETLTSTDKLDLAFRLGRAMSFLPPGRAFAGSRPARLLKELFIASLMTGGMPIVVDQPEGVAHAVRALAGLPREELERLGRLAVAIAGSRTSVNLSSWSRALARTADRIGLILCGDVCVAAAAVRAQGVDEAVDELLDYAISTEHAEVRVSLGLSIEV